MPPVELQVVGSRNMQSIINKKIFLNFHARELVIRYDTDLGDLYKVDDNSKFTWNFNIGLHVNHFNVSVKEVLAIMGPFTTDLRAFMDFENIILYV